MRRHGVRRQRHGRQRGRLAQSLAGAGGTDGRHDGGTARIAGGRRTDGKGLRRGAQADQTAPHTYGEFPAGCNGPQWQSEIATKLINTFPNIQFIVSTHSPHVINSVPTASLRLMNEDDTISEAPYGYGMPSEIVLGDIMDLDHDVPSEIVELLSRFNTALGNGDVAMANEVLTALQHRVPQHPELPRMRKKVERLSR